MPELKRFLNPLSPSLRVVYTAGTIAPLGFILFFIYQTIVGTMSLGILLMPVIFFGSFSALMCWMLVRGLHIFDKWWNTLSDAEQAEIEQDFLQGQEISYYLIAGPRYAYLRWTGSVIRYDRIGNINFVRGKNARCYMHIEMQDERKVFMDLPSFSDGELIRDALYSYCATRNAR